MVPDDDLLTLAEVAAEFRVSKQTVYRHAKAGGIPSLRVGRQYRFSRRALLVALTIPAKSEVHDAV